MFKRKKSWFWKRCFKPWDERLSREKFVESDDDQTLIFNIPFICSIKLKSICIERAIQALSAVKS